VYGEFTRGTIEWKDKQRKSKPGFLDFYRDFVKQANEVEIRCTPAIKTLEPHSCPTFMPFNNTVPDVYRADQFIRELKECEAKRELPNLIVMTLPNDHTAGTRPGMPKPASAVADNDVALGQVVEAVSNSRFWKETCIFVVEDDPQNGFDHIDGHRTVGMVISPYTRRGGAVDSTNYNQTSMVRTIELILGLPPMNQLDASATPMASCFIDKPDSSRYKAAPNSIPLDQLNPQMADIRDPRQRHWAEVSIKLPLDEVDEADEDIFNRVLWFAMRGKDETYPAWAVNGEVDDDDDREREEAGR
jgi:hypothetical protein